eukprot:5950721-Prymnesium_polylepis.1
MTPTPAEPMPARVSHIKYRTAVSSWPAAHQRGAARGGAPQAFRVALNGTWRLGFPQGPRARGMDRGTRV